MVAGGFKNDLAALNDQTAHDRRYDRLVEYTQIISHLLRGEAPVTFRGDFYQVENLRLNPALPRDLMPGVFVSGSSDAGMAASRALQATAIHYPQPATEYNSGALAPESENGIRIGIIARATTDEAWRVAYERFPDDRRGQLTHQLAMKTSDSVWHRQLSSLAEISENCSSPYWLGPFQNYKSFCPYLVGSIEEVAAEIAKYIKAGFTTFVLDIPASREELEFIGLVFEQAQSRKAFL
jgi:alkanesulfonate monooxygenase